MSEYLVNYDGGIVVTPKAVLHPERVEDIQAVLRDTERYPSPVRAMGSHHSLTPCAATNGTVVSMAKMNRVLDIDPVKRTITAQAGVEVIDAATALRAHGMQLYVNIEIGNMTLGAGACCHTKDGLDGFELAQFSSSLLALKWVTPAGDLAQAGESDRPELLQRMRASHGLAGVVYEVTFRIKPIEALHMTYRPCAIDRLTQADVDATVAAAQGLRCRIIGRTAIFQEARRAAAASIPGTVLAAIRRRLWNFYVARLARLIEISPVPKAIRELLQDGVAALQTLCYRLMHLAGGMRMLAPDKTIDYRSTPPQARYAFTFWAFKPERWLETLRAYLEFESAHHAQTGFRCNLPLGAYFVRQDRSSLLSYTYDGPMISIDPIHAITDDAAWHTFLERFNAFAAAHGGVPLLNQSPLVERAHVEAAYGARWREFSEWIRSVDPGRRMLNPFFAGLLTPS